MENKNIMTKLMSLAHTLEVARTQMEDCSNEIKHMSYQKSENLLDDHNHMYTILSKNIDAYEIRERVEDAISIEHELDGLEVRVSVELSGTDLCKVADYIVDCIIDNLQEGGYVLTKKQEL